MQSRRAAGAAASGTSITEADAIAKLTSTAKAGGGTSGDVTLNAEQKLNNTTAPYYHNVVVTVSGGKFLFDGQTSSQSLRLMPSIVYRFDQSAGSNASHPLHFSESSDGLTIAKTIDGSFLK